MPREGAPKQEQGSYSDFDGSVDSFIKHARIKASGVEKGMAGISEAASLAVTIRKLGTMGEQFPEFQYWIDRKLDEVEKLSMSAKQGKDITSEVKNWQNTMEDALSVWLLPPDREEKSREEKMWYSTRKDYIDMLAELRNIIRNASERIMHFSKDMEINRKNPLRGERFEQVRKSDLAMLERIEDAVVSGEDNESTKSSVRSLYENYHQPIPIGFRGLTPGNRIRAEINEEKKKGETA